MTQYAAWFAGRAHKLLLTVTEGTRDLSTKKVKVHYTLQIVKDVNRTTWSNGTAGQSWSITLGGTTVASGTSVVFNFDTVPHAVNPGNSFVIHKGSTEFSYGANGTLSLSVAFAANANVVSGGVTIMSTASYPPAGTVNFTPTPITTNIATQPVLTPKSAAVGQSVTVGLPRQNAAYTHDVTWVSGGLSGTIGTGLGTSTTWTVPNVTGQFPGQDQSPIKINVVTKNGATTIGTKSATLLVWNVDPSVDPTDKTPFDIRIRQVTWDGARLRAGNPIVTNSLTLVDTFCSTPTLQVETSGIVPGADGNFQSALVLVDIQTGSNWQSTGLLFVLSRSDTDDVDTTKTTRWSGTEYVSFITARGYRTSDWKINSANPGAILRDLLYTQGQGKGWGPNLVVSGNSTTTHFGDAWDIADAYEISDGTPYSQVIESLVNDGWIEYRTRYDDATGKARLEIYNPVTGSDWSDGKSKVVVNMATAAVSEIPVTWSMEGILDRVYARGDAATNDPETADDNTPAPLASVERTPFNVNLFGKLEGFVSASGQTTASAARRVAANALANASKSSSRTFVYDPHAVSRSLLPYYTYRPGDWILIPNDRNRSGQPVSIRVMQVTIAKGDDGIKITANCGDLFPSSATASVAKRIRASTGGRIAGGTLKAPIPLQMIVPAAPALLSETPATSEGYWNSNGEPRSAITFTWEPVLTALDELTSLTIDYYEVWTRPNPGAEWALKTFSPNTTVEIPDYAVYETVQLRVRARSSAGTLGEFSAYSEVTTLAPTASIPALAISSLYTNGLGTIFADWNGNLGSGSSVPSYFAYMSAEISPDNGANAPTGVWSPKGNSLNGPGTITIQPGSYGKWWVRFRAYDALGGPGVNGTASSITLVDPASIVQPTPKAPTSVVATAQAAWDAFGVNTGDYFAVSWAAVTQDTTNAAITIALYEVDGLLAGGQWSNVLRTSATSGRVPVLRGQSWSFRVRAIATNGMTSAWSTTVGPTAASAALTAMPLPSAPEVTSAKASLYVEWNGLTSTGAAYANNSGFRYAYVEVAPDVAGVAGTWERAGSAFPGRAGTSIINGLAFPGSYHARIVAVDGTNATRTGAAVGPTPLVGVSSSDITPGTILGDSLDDDFADGAVITGATIQTDEGATEGVKIASGGLVAYDQSGNATFIIDAATGSLWFGDGTISGNAIDVTTIDVANLQAELISNGIGDSLTIGATSLVSIISGLRSDVDDQGANLSTYFDFGESGQWKSNADQAVTGLRIASTSATEAFNTFSFSGGFQIRRGSTALAWWEADPNTPSLVRFTTPNITVLNDLNVGSHKMRPGAAGITILSAQ